MYLDENLTKRLLAKISEKLSCSNTNEAFLTIDDLAKTFGIEGEDFETTLYEIAEILKRVDVGKFGVEITETVHGIDPTAEEVYKVKNIDSLGNSTPDIKYIVFKIDIPKFIQTKDGEVSTKKTSFDLDKSILSVGKSLVRIKKFGDQYHLLRIIFEDRNETAQEWFFSEIAERYDHARNLPDKKFYNTIYQIKKKLAIEGIKDFFDATTNQSFKINRKYLEQ